MKRILVWGLSNNRAGTEKVIETYCSSLPDIHFDFLCYEYPENYVHLLHGKDCKATVIPIKIKHPVANCIELRKFSRSHVGYYDALWFNVNDFSNIDLLIEASNTMRIPRRIVHMHNAGIPNIMITKVFSRLNYDKVIRLGTEFWACSKAAGEYAFPTIPYAVVPNLVDDTKFAYSQANRLEIRTRHAIQDSTFVVGSTGRLAPQKNYSFLIRAFAKFHTDTPDSLLLLVGEGDLLELLQQQTKELGVQDAVIFAGQQPDVEKYYSAFDVFALTSLYEGLSVSAIEAQFNGLPCVLSAGVPREASITTSSVFISTDESDSWVKAFANATRKNVKLTAHADLFRISNLKEIAESLFEYQVSN